MILDRTVLLYSGGLDSYALAALAKPDLLLYVDTGTTYGRVEQARIMTPPALTHRYTSTSLRDLALFERFSDMILPGRNAHLVLVAANYANTILMAATAGDAVHDKDQQFADLMNPLLAHLYSKQNWLPEGRPVRLELPAKQTTKRQLVAKYLHAGHDPAHLATRTFSCYKPTADGEHCAACKPCVRKWAALVVHGIDPGYDAREGLAKYVATIREGKWVRGDDADMIEAWEQTQ